MKLEIIEECVSLGEFEWDVLRSTVLGAYMKFWGMPEFRKISKKQEHKIEVYFFPSTAEVKVSRFATVGLFLMNGAAAPIKQELLLTLPADLGGASLDEAFNFVLDFGAHVAHCANVDQLPLLFPESAIAPLSWKTWNFMVDEARSEPEELSEMTVGSFQFSLKWIIPLHKSEFNFIKIFGIKKFDEISDKSEISLIDMSRNPMI